MSNERKVAVITDASQGIGRPLLKDIAIAITRSSRRQGRSGQTTNDDQILVVSGDITDRKTAERAISEGLARFGHIVTLTNNAGVFVAKPSTQ